MAVPSMSVVSGDGWIREGEGGEPQVGQQGGARWVTGLFRTVPLPLPVKAPVCLSRELGVMQPGQTVVELSADGVCHTSRCTDVLDPLTSFYQINITSVLCDMHCEAVGAMWGARSQRPGLADPHQFQKSSLESRHQSSLRRPRWRGAQLGVGVATVKGLN